MMEKAGTYVLSCEVNPEANQGSTVKVLGQQHRILLLHFVNRLKRDERLTDEDKVFLSKVNGLTDSAKKKKNTDSASHILSLFSMTSYIIQKTE